MGYELVTMIFPCPHFHSDQHIHGTHGHGPRCTKDQQDVMVEKVPAPGSPHDLGNPHINHISESYQQVVPFLMSIPGTLDPFDLGYLGKCATSNHQWNKSALIMMCNFI